MKIKAMLDGSMMVIWPDGAFTIMPFEVVSALILAALKAEAER